MNEYYVTLRHKVYTDYDISGAYEVQAVNKHDAGIKARQLWCDAFGWNFDDTEVKYVWELKDYKNGY